MPKLNTSKYNYRYRTYDAPFYNIMYTDKNELINGVNMIMGNNLLNKNNVNYIMYGEKKNAYYGGKYNKMRITKINIDKPINHRRLIN